MFDNAIMERIIKRQSILPRIDGIQLLDNPEKFKLKIE